MFREKEICNAIRTAYLYLFPDKKERKRALSRLNMELVAQSVRYRGESVLAYQTAGNHECSLNYYGPELFPQRGFCIYQKTIQSHSTQVDASCIRELWLLEDGRFVDNVIVAEAAQQEELEAALGRTLLDAGPLGMETGDYYNGAQWTRNVDGEQVPLPVGDHPAVEEALRLLEEGETDVDE